MYSTFSIAAILDARSPGSRSNLYTDMHSKMNSILKWPLLAILQWRIQGGGGGGGATGAPPKIGSTVFFNPSFIRMFNNKAQIARERALKQPYGFQCPYAGPAESEFSSALVMCVRAHNLLRPPPPPHENPGSASVMNTILLILLIVLLTAQKMVYGILNDKDFACAVIEFSWHHLDLKSLLSEIQDGHHCLFECNFHHIC